MNFANKTQPVDPILYVYRKMRCMFTRVRETPSHVLALFYIDGANKIGIIALLYRNSYAPTKCAQRTSADDIVQVHFGG